MLANEPNRRDFTKLAAAALEGLTATRSRDRLLNEPLHRQRIVEPVVLPELPSEHLRPQRRTVGFIGGVYAG